MNKQQIALKLILDELGHSVDVGSFQKRLVLQKECYLVQASGVNLGYYFGWYLHGPYCSALAKDAFAVSDELSAQTDESEDWELDQQTMSRLQRVKSLVSECCVEDEARKLELLASVHFLVTRKDFPANDTSNLTLALRRFGKECNESEVASATEGLAKYGFILKQAV